MSLTVADNQGVDPNEQERKEQEAKTPPVNPKYPFTMIPFPYDSIAPPSEPLNKTELVLRGID